MCMQHFCFAIIPAEFEQAQSKQVTIFLKHGRPKVLCEDSGSVEVLKKEEGGGIKANGLCALRNTVSTLINSLTVFLCLT